MLGGQPLLSALQVPSRLAVLSAAHRALTAQRRQRLRTRSLHAELVFNLSGSKHVSDGLAARLAFIT